MIMTNNNNTVNHNTNEKPLIRREHREITPHIRNTYETHDHEYTHNNTNKKTLTYAAQYIY